MSKKNNNTSTKTKKNNKTSNKTKKNNNLPSLYLPNHTLLTRQSSVKSSNSPNLKNVAPFLMGRFTPIEKASFREINRSVSTGNYNQVSKLNIAQACTIGFQRQTMIFTYFKIPDIYN